MKCSECNYAKFEAYRSGPNRYYCTNPKATEGVGCRVICRTDRGSAVMKIKTSPQWCPKRCE